MDFFEEISKAKRDLPKVNSITKEVKNYSLNFYQILSIGLSIGVFFLGIILGNLFVVQ